MTEIHHSGVTVVNDPDVEWFTWSPRTETIALQPAFGPVFKRGTATLALAHRALGHWGMSMRQDMEARELTAGWLINERLATYAAAAIPTIGVVGVAQHLGVTPHVLQVRVAAGPVPVPDERRHLSRGPMRMRRDPGGRTPGGQRLTRGPSWPMGRRSGRV